MSAGSLVSAVQAALGSATTLGYASSVKAHDVYEAYVLTQFLEAADDRRWTWELRDHADLPTTRAVFRRGPGRLPTVGFTHAYLFKPGRRPLEAHIGVKVYGRSLRGVSRRTKSGHLLHEFDLLVLPWKVAVACRSSHADPAFSDVVAHGEAKFYGGNLPLPIGRAAVGMAVECALSGKSTLVTNRIGLAVQDLVSRHGVAFRFRIVPANPIGEFLLRQEFARILDAAP